MRQPKPLRDLRFARTEDAALLRCIITNPSVWPMSGDESAPPVEEFEVVEHPAIWYVLAYDGEELLGLLTFVPVNQITMAVHCALLPESFGRSATVLSGGFRWVWQHTPCRRIEARVPEFNRLALQLARKAGMMVDGKTVMSFTKYGKRFDEILLGINAQEEK